MSRYIDDMVESSSFFYKTLDELKNELHFMNDKFMPTGVYDLKMYEFIKDHLPLFILSKTPYLYSGGVFKRDDNESELKSCIRFLMHDRFVKADTVNRVYKLFFQDNELTVNDDEVNNYPKCWINFQNGFYDPIEKKMVEHDPKYKATTQIPHIYEPDRELYSDFIEEWLGFMFESKEDREMLLQYAGYCLTRDTSMQTFMILNGEAGTGKSVILDLLTNMVGECNAAHLPLEKIGERFMSYQLVDKLLNSCGDLEISALEKTATLKQVTGEDTIMVEPKSKPLYNAKLFCKLIFSTNELPTILSERSNGVFRRLLVLKVDKVPAKIDEGFRKKVLQDIDYFIMLSVKALERMYEAGHMLRSENSKKAVKQLRIDSDTIEGFIDSEGITKSESSWIVKSDLFSEYEAYCTSMGRTPHKRSNFYRGMTTKGFIEVKHNGKDSFKCKKSPKKSPEESPDDVFLDLDGIDIDQVKLF